MQYALTLTGDPRAPSLTDEAAAAASAALAAWGARDIRPAWLAPAVALDLTFDAASVDGAGEAVRGALAGLAADINLQPLAGRRKRILIADMDSTIITGESLDDLADFIGIKDQVAPGRCAARSISTPRCATGCGSWRDSRRVCSTGCSRSASSLPAGPRRWCGPCERTGPSRPWFRVDSLS
jgi:hypothetical protein